MTDAVVPDPKAGGVPAAGPQRRWSLLGMIAVVLGPIAGNLPAIIGLVKYEPQAITSGIGLITKVGFLPGRPFIDPNIGYNSQTLGHASALAWLHGHIPWWNLNEGLGMPLAASVQSASFFPVTLLQAFPQGSLLFHLAVEILIGLCTYGLLRELRCSVFAASCGAIAFELCGAVAWVTNAPLNPIAFLPLCLLGVEYVIAAAGRRRVGGWVILALGVWLSVVAGFPEVAVINIGLVVCWFVVRLVQHLGVAVGTIVRGALGGVVGLLLAAPVLNAFVRYLKIGNVGLHSQDLASIAIPRSGLAQLVTPYVFGAIGDDGKVQSIVELWSRVGGYSGITLIVLSIGALFGSRERLLRWMLAAWAIVFLGSDYDVPVLHTIVEHIPGLAHVAIYRYSISSVLLCMCVLAALCIDDLRGLSTVKILTRVVPGFVVAVVIWCVGFYSSPQGRAWARTNLPRWYWGSIILLACVAVFILAVALLALTSMRRLVPVLLGAMLVIESLGFFVVPILSWPRAVHYDTSPATYLAANLGTQRYFSAGPLGPNYGTYFDVASLDAADLPVPKNWANYVASSLDPDILPWQFGDGSPQPALHATELTVTLAHIANFEGAGVKYLLTGKPYLLSYLQPRNSPGTPTPDGGATVTLSFAPPTYFVTGSLQAISIPLPGGAPAGLAVTVCSMTCEQASDAGASSTGTTFFLAAPLVLGPSLTVHLDASNAHPVTILTQATGTTDSPSSVATDGSVLPDRASVVTFTYVPSSIPVLVHESIAASIYLLPHYSPIATAPGCTVDAHSMTSFTATCAHASVLTYRELSFPGWKASVAGNAASITTLDHVFQQVALPAGTSAVSFSYSPPESDVAWIACLVGIVAVCASLVRRRRPPRRGAHAKGSSSPADAGGGAIAPPVVDADVGTDGAADPAPVDHAAVGAHTGELPVERITRDAPPTAPQP